MQLLNYKTNSNSASKSQNKMHGVQKKPQPKKKKAEVSVSILLFLLLLVILQFQKIVPKKKRRILIHHIHTNTTKIVLVQFTSPKMMQYYNTLHLLSTTKTKKIIKTTKIISKMR